MIETLRVCTDCGHAHGLITCTAQIPDTRSRPSNTGSFTCQCPMAYATRVIQPCDCGHLKGDHFPNRRCGLCECEYFREKKQ